MSETSGKTSGKIPFPPRDDDDDDVVRRVCTCVGLCVCVVAVRRKIHEEIRAHHIIVRECAV